MDVIDIWKALKAGSSGEIGSELKILGAALEKGKGPIAKLIPRSIRKGLPTYEQMGREIAEEFSLIRGPSGKVWNQSKDNCLFISSAVAEKLGFKSPGNVNDFWDFVSRHRMARRYGGSSGHPKTSPVNLLVREGKTDSQLHATIEAFGKEYNYGSANPIIDRIPLFKIHDPARLSAKSTTIVPPIDTSNIKWKNIGSIRIPKHGETYNKIVGHIPGRMNTWVEKTIGSDFEAGKSFVGWRKGLNAWERSALMAYERNVNKLFSLDLQYKSTIKQRELVSKFLGVPIELHTVNEVFGKGRTIANTMSELGEFGPTSAWHQREGFIGMPTLALSSMLPGPLKNIYRSASRKTLKAIHASDLYHEGAEILATQSLESIDARYRTIKSKLAKRYRGKPREKYNRLEAIAWDRAHKLSGLGAYQANLSHTSPDVLDFEAYTYGKMRWDIGPDPVTKLVEYRLKNDLWVEGRRRYESFLKMGIRESPPVRPIQESGYIRPDNPFVQTIDWDSFFKKGKSNSPINPIPGSPGGPGHEQTKRAIDSDFGSRYKPSGSTAFDKIANSRIRYGVFDKYGIGEAAESAALSFVYGPELYYSLESTHKIASNMLNFGRRIRHTKLRLNRALHISNKLAFRKKQSSIIRRSVRDLVGLLSPESMLPLLAGKVSTYASNVGGGYIPHILLKQLMRHGHRYAGVNKVVEALQKIPSFDEIYKSKKGLALYWPENVKQRYLDVSSEIGSLDDVGRFVSSGDLGKSGRILAGGLSRAELLTHETTHRAMSKVFRGPFGSFIEAEKQMRGKINKALEATGTPKFLLGSGNRAEEILTYALTTRSFDAHPAVQSLRKEILAHPVMSKWIDPQTGRFSYFRMQAFLGEGVGGYAEKYRGICQEVKASALANVIRKHVKFQPTQGLVESLHVRKVMHAVKSTAKKVSKLFR